MPIRRLYLGILFLFFCLNPGSIFSFDSAVPPLEAKPLPQFKTPEIKTHVFSNGLRLYFLPNDDLPLFQANAMIQFSSLDESREKRGLVQMLMSAMETGGTKKQSGDEIDKILEYRAASIDAQHSHEWCSLSAKSLSKDHPLILQLLFDMMTQPAFEENKVELVRKRMLDSITRRNEDPGNIADREFAQSMYGESSPLARLFNQETVKNLSRENLFSFLDANLDPARVWIAVSGDVSWEKLVALVEKLNENFVSRKISRPSRDPVLKEWKPGVEFVSKETNQASIIVGHFGEKRFNPDKYALMLANYVLGGTTFGSRLGDTIRTKLGLAYAINSNFGFETDYGLFKMKAQTKSASTATVIGEMKHILGEMILDYPVTQAELDEAKKAILNNLIFQYSDPFEIVMARMHYDYYGYPPDYFEVFQREIARVTVDEVNAVLKKYFYPDKLKILVVGDKKAVGNLSEFGPVVDRPLDNQ